MERHGESFGPRGWKRQILVAAELGDQDLASPLHTLPLISLRTEEHQWQEIFSGPEDQAKGVKFSGGDLGRLFTKVSNFYG